MTYESVLDLLEKKVAINLIGEFVPLEDARELIKLSRISGMRYILELEQRLNPSNSNQNAIDLIIRESELMMGVKNVSLIKVSNPKIKIEIPKLPPQPTHLVTHIKENTPGPKKSQDGALEIIKRYIHGLGEHHLFTTSEVFDNLPYMPINSVYNALSVLNQLGYITRIKMGKYKKLQNPPLGVSTYAIPMAK